MEKIELLDKFIYRAEEGKKLKIKGNKNLYSEIMCKKDSTLEIEEVNDNE